MDNTSTNSIHNSQAPLLPRFAWNSQLAHLKVLFKAKKALDQIEKDALSPKPY